MKMLGVLIGVAVAGVAQVGGADSLRQPESLMRIHFAGGDAILSDPDLSYLEKIAGLPATETLWKQAVQEAASPVARYLAPELDWAETSEQLQGDIRRLLVKWVRSPSTLEVWRIEGRPSAWMLALRLEASERKAWRRALERVIKAGNTAAPLPIGEGRFSGWEIKRPGPRRVLRYLQSEGWVVVYDGPEGWPSYRRAVGQLPKAESIGSLSKPSGRSLLHGEVDLKLLSRELKRPKSLKGEDWSWPHADFSITNRADRLKTTVDLTFSKDLSLQLESWQVPTNTIREPLISFTAARGITPLLKKLKPIKALPISPLPGQFYAWSLSGTPFQLYGIFPVDNATEVAQRMAEVLSKRLKGFIEERSLGSIVWDEEKGIAQWRGLAFVSPFLRPVQEPRGEYLQIGMFPSGAGQKPPPKELLAQIHGREDLVYYSWEVTQVRLKYWRALMQLRNIFLYGTTSPRHMVPGKPGKAGRKGDNPSSEPEMTPANEWISKVAPHLGNTATEARQISDRKLRLVRNSDLGLSGFELVRLVRWLDAGMAENTVGAAAKGKAQTQ